MKGSEPLRNSTAASLHDHELWRSNAAGTYQTLVDLSSATTSNQILLAQTLTNSSQALNFASNIKECKHRKFS